MSAVLIDSTFDGSISDTRYKIRELAIIILTALVLYDTRPTVPGFNGDGKEYG